MIPVSVIRNRPASPGMQGGVVLLEAMIAVLIFSIGLLGMLGMQAASVSAVSDAKYRSEAALVADQIIARIWADQAHIVDYDTGGAVGLEGYEANLPNGKRDVSVGALPAAGLPQMRTVTVTITWQPPGDTSEHKFETETQISAAT